MKLYTVLLIHLALLITTQTPAQNVGIGTTTPHSSAALDVQSTNKGVSLPSMSTAQRNSIADPKAGLLVFDIDKNTLYMFDGGQWVALLFTVSESLVPPVTRTASDGAVGDQFGFTVSMSGNYAVIGAPYDNVSSNANQGSAYVFFRSGSVWTEQARLFASDGAANDLFGHSVSISGSYVIVGAHQDNTTVVDGGSAYVFIRSGTTWSEQAKLVASNTAANDHFGFSVGISGSYVIVGASDDDIGANIDEGSMYIFFRSGTNWSQQDNVVAPFGSADDHFGFSVGISGDYAVAGAPDDDIGMNDGEGNAHVFIRSGVNWNYHDALERPAGGAGDRFGASVAIDGNYIIIGAPDDASYFGSTANIFFRNGLVWNHQAILNANPVQANNNGNMFGISVSIDGDYVVVGSTLANVNGNLEQGAAYVFKRDGSEWLFVRRIENTGGGSDGMGISTAVSGLNCLVGVSNADALKGKVFFLNIE